MMRPIQWAVAVLSLQMTVVAAAGLCGAFAPRDMVEMLQTSTAIFLGCGGGALASGIFLVCIISRRRSPTTAKAAVVGLWLGHSVLCTGGAALIAAWAGGWACCDPLQHAVMQDGEAVGARRMLLPMSLLLMDADSSSSDPPTTTTSMCDITTVYSNVGRRAVVACCLVALGAFVYANAAAAFHHYDHNAPAAVIKTITDVGRAVGLGAIFASIACNEDDWDWRPIYAMGIAFIGASFFAAAATTTTATTTTRRVGVAARPSVAEAVAAGWCFATGSDTLLEILSLLAKPTH